MCRIDRIYVCVGLLSIILCGCSSHEVRQEYFANGRVRLQTTLESGLRNGEMLVYDSLGNLRERRMYVRDTLQGPFFKYFEDESTSSVAVYERGKREGGYVSFYSNGNIAMQGFFKRDHRRGLWWNYSETDSGKVMLENYILNVEGHEEPYYVEWRSRGDTLYTSRRLAFNMNKTLGPHDIMVFALELFANEFDSAFLIVGEYDEDFYLKGKADTVRVKNNHAVVKFEVGEPGVFFVRGLVVGFMTKTSGDSTPVVVKFPTYFEEKYKVREGIVKPRQA